MKGNTGNIRVLRGIISEAVRSALYEGASAREIKQAIASSLWELKNTGEANVVFGDNVGDQFTIYLKDENTVGVDYMGRSADAPCRDIYSDNALISAFQIAFMKAHMG